MHQADGRVVSNFIVQALLGEPIRIYGDGQQTRSFCYVDDLVEAMIACMNSGDEVTGPINLGNPEEFTILELAEEVIRLTGSNSEIVYDPVQENDPMRRRPDISKAETLLGWRPSTALAAGLPKTIEYFREIVAQMKVR